MSKHGSTKVLKRADSGGADDWTIIRSPAGECGKSELTCPRNPVPGLVRASAAAHGAGQERRR